MRSRSDNLTNCTLDLTTVLAAVSRLDAADHAPHASTLAPFDTCTEHACLRCDGRRLIRHGRGRTGTQRWRCRDCGRTVSSTSGTPLAGLHAPAKLRLVVADMLSSEPSSCRRLGAALGLSKMTIWAWRQKISGAFAVVGKRACRSSDTHSIDGAAAPVLTILRESRKASREWVDHRRDPVHCPKPDRLRWLDYRMHDLGLPRPMTPYLLLISLDSNGRPQFHFERADTQLGARATVALTAGSAQTCVGGRAGTEVPIDSERSDRSNRLLGSTRARAGENRPAPLAPSELVDRFREFIGAFSGPATKYLDRYLAWFGARLRATDGRRRQQVVEQALALLTMRLPTRSWDMTSLPSASRQRPSGAA